MNTDKADNLLSDAKDGLDEGETNVGLGRPDAEMPVERLNPNYNMKHKKRGLAVILSYSEYKNGRCDKRTSASHDTKICQVALKKLGYDVEIYENLPKKNFISRLKTVRDIDHGQHDSLVVVCMSHGGVDDDTKQEFIETYDSKINTSELWKYFTAEKCPSLAGKPKLFFIQACRGEDVDKGIQLKKKKKMQGLSVEVDSITQSYDPDEDYSIPLHADMLVMWASYPGMYAFRSTRNGMAGSVFIHFLSKVLEEDSSKDDLMRMLVRVTREVAVHFESACDDPIKDKNKQVPQLQSTLMRQVEFF